MRVLFVTSRKDCDYLASSIWDGLQQLLGEENVVDAVNSPWLHKSTCDELCSAESPTAGHAPIIRGISGSREGASLTQGMPKFDLMIVNACFMRERNWDFIEEGRELFCKEDAQIAYIEGWDAAWQVEPPQMRVDAYFRKEIAPGVAYPMPPHYLTFAAPERWFIERLDLGMPRPIDLFFSGNPDACLPGQEVRRPMLANVFRTRKSHHSIIATHRMGYEQYFSLLRQSKFALCPSGADLTDSLRTFEAVACGAIPIFVGYPDHLRDPWFPNETCISCTADTLPEHVDEALSHDSVPRRRALLEHARKYHTTVARARQLLERLGVEL
jgi:Exostosin family/Glycosyl transferases group 1